MSTCGAGRCAFSSCWARSLSLPHSPAPRINGLRLERTSRRLRLPDSLVDIGGYRLHLWCTGDGAPAVILDTGLGGSSAGWGFVQPEVARFTRVCSYDRAGMGYSDPGPSPRTARRIASELAELLARSGIAGPVVLVGASIAGFDVRVFASDHPERAAGLVLVDASHEDDAHEVPRMARFVPLLSTIGVLRLFGVSFGQRSNRWLHQCGNSRRRRVSAQRDTRRRLTRSFTFGRARRKSGARAASSPSLSSSSPVRRGADENWRQLQQDQASLSDRGCLIIAQQSGHVVAIDQPEVVVDAIRTVVETARGHDVPLCATPRTLNETHLDNEFAFSKRTGALPPGLRSLSQRVDPATSSRDMVPTRENPAH